jgi:hypothetical protein|tara:strand:- start:1288 stop:1686 length:399 start_codon:yes stop_codon:yes gene_type:complete
MTTKFDRLTNKNYVMYAMKNYDNPQCLDIEEFYSDLNRIKYLKRLFRRYLTSGELKERLILNHLIILYNVFGIVPATRILFHRMEDEFHPILKTCIVYLNNLPEDGNAEKISEVDLLTIPMDNKVIEILRGV